MLAVNESSRYFREKMEKMVNQEHQVSADQKEK